MLQQIVPITCDKNVCPESKGHFLKEEDAKEGVEGFGFGVYGVKAFMGRNRFRG